MQEALEGERQALPEDDYLSNCPAEAGPEALGSCVRLCVCYVCQEGREREAAEAECVFS